MALSSILFALAPPAIVGGVAWWRAREAAPSPTTPPHRDPHIDPVELPDDDALAAAACSCTSGLPDLDQPRVASCVWAGFFPAIAWPPVPGDHQSILQAADMVLDAVARAQSGGCPVDGEPVSPDEAKGAVDITKWFSRDPWPEHLYQLRQGDVLLGDEGVIARAIFRATYEHALGAGLDDAVAQQIAAANAGDPGNRMAYLHAIQCESVWNAKLYGSKVYGDRAVPSSNGLAIRQLPYHAANYDRIASGLPPQRRLNIETGMGNGGYLELLWLPALDPIALLDINRQIQISTAGQKWADGTPKTLPPPQIQALGLEGVPTGIDWGCN